MSIYGYQADIQPVDAVKSPEELDGFIDDVYNELADHAEFYSVDVVSDNSGKITVLLGIEVAEGGPSRALEIGRGALDAAFEKFGESIEHAEQIDAQVHKMDLVAV